jgi:acyl-ACP thioesterase
MDPRKLIYKADYRIYPKDSDYKSHIRPGALINYFIQSAWLHAEDLGFGYSQLIEQGIGWVLSRFRIVIDKMPEWPGDISLVTWPKGVDRILYLRDAEIFDRDNERMAYLTSSWLVIDVNTKRPQRSLPEANSFLELTSRSAIDDPAPALKFTGAPDHTEKFRVRYNDIDINMHLTTYRYIDFVFDTYDIEFLKVKVPEEITVNFLKEIPFGAELEMRRIENGPTHQFELINTENGIASFRAEVKFKAAEK